MIDFIIIFCAKYLLYIIALIAVIFFILTNKKSKVDIVKISTISAPLALILARISSYFIDNPRPFVVDHLVPLIPHAVNNGFPSDHTLAAMLIALIVYLYSKKTGTLLIILALMIGIARILARVHHPADIVGSVLIDLVALYLSSLILKKFSPARE